MKVSRSGMRETLPQTFLLFAYNAKAVSLHATKALGGEKV
jgi:hypothetical protein